MKLFVGIDVSSEKLDTCFLTDELTVLIEDTYANDSYGATALKNQLLKLQKQFHFDQLVIGMESTSMYSFHPALFFQEDEDLQALQTIVKIGRASCRERV